MTKQRPYISVVREFAAAEAAGDDIHGRQLCRMRANQQARLLRTATEVVRRPSAVCVATHGAPGTEIFQITLRTEGSLLPDEEVARQEPRPTG